MNEHEKHEKYDIDELRRLWKLDYKLLAEAPGGPNGRLREARFVMQAKAALETQSLIRITFWMAVATFLLALATIALAVLEFFKK